MADYYLLHSHLPRLHGFALGEELALLRSGKAGSSGREVRWEHTGGGSGKIRRLPGSYLVVTLVVIILVSWFVVERIPPKKMVSQFFTLTWLDLMS